MRIYGLGDLHVDFPANRELLSTLSSVNYQQDILVLSGDIGHRIELIGTTLGLLRERFARVFFVPGNHDLWVAGAAADVVEETSLDRLVAIQALCVEEGVDTEAGQIGRVQILPMLSSGSLNSQASMFKLSSYSKRSTIVCLFLL